MYDIIIIGAGPSGMTAALYVSQARKNVLILEKEVYGGQILKADKIKNYPGFLQISGYEFATKLYEQITALNVPIQFEEVINIKNLEDYKEIKTKQNTYKTRAVIIASGAQNRKLGLPNEEKLIGKGISYCATCDGMFFKNKIVAITGGGNSAIDDAIYLSDIAKKVYIVYRQKDFRLDSINLETLKNKPNIEFILNSNIIDIKGMEKLESITIVNNDTENKINIDIDGLFIAIGHIPVSNICNEIINTDEKGYVIADETCKTNVEGVFVAGDLRTKDVRQLTTAEADGTIAAINACKYINKNYKN